MIDFAEDSFDINNSLFTQGNSLGEGQVGSGLL